MLQKCELYNPCYCTDKYTSCEIIFKRFSFVLEAEEKQPLHWPCLRNYLLPMQLDINIALRIFKGTESREF
jgi:hypothetical protein